MGRSQQKVKLEIKKKSQIINFKKLKMVKEQFMIDLFIFLLSIEIFISYYAIQ